MFKDKEDRVCGNCTKCCDGFLYANIRGIEMGNRPGVDVDIEKIHNPKPCFFVITESGCSDYKNRPENPCKSFKCMWLKNKDMPEDLKPVLSKSITIKSNYLGIDYLSIIEAGQKLDSKVLEWHIKYCLRNNLNLTWNINGEVQWMGSEEFNEMMLKKYPYHSNHTDQFNSFSNK
jgi:hypothetical protein